MFFINTHSDRDRGDLFYHQGELQQDSASTNVAEVRTPPPLVFCPCALTRNKFFDVVVGQELCEYISGCEYSMMILGTCGSVVNVPTSLEEVREVVKKCVPTLPHQLSS